MSLTGYPIPRFGGLNTTDDPEDVGPTGAIDLLNIDFNKHGRIRSRDGYAKFTAAAGPNPYSDLHSFYQSSGTAQVLALIPDDRVQALDSNGNVSASLLGAPFASPNHLVFADFGKPGTGAANEVEYVYMGNGSEAMRRWDGAAFTAPANMPKGCPYVFPRSNRLVATCFDAGSHVLGPAAAQSSQSFVYFSDAGDPETWTATNYVNLTPGDGERIHGAASWREHFFVFKNSKFFVFGVETPGPTGLPIFNYRTVDTGVGLSGYSPGMEASGAIAVGPDGVYFLNERGVWRTTGDAPVRISRVLDFFFDGTASTAATQSPTRLRDVRMVWHNERLWFSIASSASSTNDLVVVFDPVLDAWFMHNIPAFGMTPFRSTTREDLLFAYATGTNNIGRHSSASTTDDGTAISTRYQSGFYQPSPTNEVTTRWTELRGTGSPTFDIFTDHATSDPLARGGTVTLGTSPQVAKGYHLKSYTGQLLSHKLSSTSGAWSLNRIEHQITNVFQPS